MEQLPMRIYVAGHRGMVGGAISRKLRERGAEVITRTHCALSLQAKSLTAWCWQPPK
jgi:nucleoside-diphosphate-sugar epimerase